MGSVVDNEVLDLLDRLSQTRLAHIKSQLQQWLDAESPTLQGCSEDQIRSRLERTIFAVSFGVWDIWNLMTKAKDYDTAVGSIDRRIKRLFEQPDKLSERWGSSSLKLNLTQTVDVTFLPGFTTGGSGDYKDAVKILDI